MKKALFSPSTLFYAALFAFHGTAGVSAATLTWNPGGDPGNIVGGAGTWDESSLVWTTEETTQVFWDSLVNAADTAVFTTGRGLVTVDGTFSLAGLNLSATSTTSVGAISNSGYQLVGGTLAFGALQGSIAVSSDTTNHQIGSALAGSAGLTIASVGGTSGQGRLILSGDNTGLTGGITLTSGLVGFISQNAAGANTITLNGGGIFGATNYIDANGTTVITPTTQTLSNAVIVNDVAGNSIRVWGSRTLVLSGSISGSGAFEKTDTGTLELTANHSSYSGDITVSAGTLRFNRGTNSGNTLTTGVVTFGSGTTFNMVQQHGGSYTSGRTFALGSQLVLNGATVDFGSSNGAQYTRVLNATAWQINSASTIRITNGNYNQSVRIEGAVTGSGNLTLNRSGTRHIYLGGDMSGFSGNVAASGGASGVIVFGNASGWGTGDLTVNGTGTTVILGDQLLTVHHASWTGGTLGFTSGTLAAQGVVTLASGSILQVNNRASGYNVQFEARGGIVANGATLGANGTAGTSAFVPYEDTTWTFNGTANTVSADINAAYVNATLVVTNASGTTVVSGSISGANALNVTGAGVLELSGDSTGFTGGFNVTDGHLLVTGTAGSGAITLSGSSTLNGTGSVGAVTVGANSVFSSGLADATGVLSVQDNVTLQAGATWLLHIEDLADFDALTFTGVNKDLTFAVGSTLQVVSSEENLIGQYQIITGGANIIGLDGLSISIDPAYNAVLGLDGKLTITAIPEPSAYALLTGVVFGGMALLRRRKK